MNPRYHRNLTTLIDMLGRWYTLRRYPLSTLWSVVILVNIIGLTVNVIGLMVTP